jgi:hypothetical protein
MSARPTPELLEIPVGDGVTLSALRYPAARHPAPAVVTFTPYRKESPFGSLVSAPLAHDIGCDLIVVDTLGMGGSGGVWDGPYSPTEITAAARALEQIAEQPFNTGRTALLGASYPGGIQYLIAARKPRGLRCITPQIAPVDSYRDLWHRGGMPSHGNWGALAARLNQHRADTKNNILTDFYTKTTADLYDSDRFRTRSGETVLDDIEVPALVTGGWYDYFLRGTIRAFDRLSVPKRLFIGNWCHEEVSPEPEAEQIKRWLAYWLLDEGDDPTEGDNVVLQLVGTDEWVSYPDWPATGKLPWQSWHPITTPTPVPVLTSTNDLPPAHPSHLPMYHDMYTDSGMRLWGEAWTAQSDPVAETTRYRGPVAFRVELQTGSATDLDLHARLSLVRGDGSVHQVTEGRLRASQREVDIDRSQLTGDGDIAWPWHTHETATPLVPGEATTVDIEIFPIHLQLEPGDRLQIGLSITRKDPVVAPETVALLPRTRVLLPRESGQRTPVA